QRQPLTLAVFVEARNVERTVIQWAFASCSQPTPRCAAFELVQVFPVFVVAAVNHDLATPLENRGALVFNPAQRGTFNRRAFGVEGVDLHHPAKPLDLVWV